MSIEKFLKTKEMKDDEPVNAATGGCYDYVIMFIFIYINNTMYQANLLEDVDRERPPS